MPRNYNSLNFRGPFTDLTDLRVTHEALDRIVLRVAVTAVDLHGFDRRAHRELGAEELGHRCFLAIRPSVLREPSCMEHQVLSGLDLRRHVGELELNTLEVGDRLAELPTQRCVTKRVLERAFGDA